MAGAQIEQKVLPEIVGSIDVEHEKIRLCIEDPLLRFLQAAGDFDVGPWGGLTKCSDNLRSKPLGWF